ncbi:hypothetical protein LguiB_008186 [Lonicera macranthoides]
MIPYSIFDERRWVIHICQTLNEEIEDETANPATIFNVPKTLMANNPDCFVPRRVALGPYHYLLPELYEMQKYKIVAAKRIQRHLQGLNFQHLVDQFKSLEPRIRACYHKYLDLNGETLAWMMALDASFLFEFLPVYDPKEDGSLRRAIKCPNAVVRDMVMLENQIPLSLVRMLGFQFSLPIDDLLLSALRKFCEEISPFKMEVEINVQDKDRSHLLDFLYHKIVDKHEETSESTEHQEDHSNDENEDERKSFIKTSHVKTLLDNIWSFITKLNKAPVSFLYRVLISKPIKVALNLPWTIVTSLPGVKFLKQKCFSQNPSEATNGEYSCLDEIPIPSVTELSKIGVGFSPTNGGILTVSFDEGNFILHLPTITLDVSTEVVLRNLVAYEACNVSGPLVFGRYIELMNGIIDTEGDVKLLREKGIICNRLKSDKEVAKMWNGMNKRVRMTKVGNLDKVIEDVNRCYNGNWRVKVGKVTKALVFGAWQFVILLVTVLILVLMSLQAFCSVYKCGHIDISSSY